MSDVVRKSDCKTFYSVNTPDYPEAEYLINPANMKEIETLPQEYRKISGSTVVEMSTAEKAAVDTAKPKPVSCPLGLECRFTVK